MSIHFISTLAEVDIDNPVYSTRKTEYSVSLNKILHYGYPVNLIRSETNTTDKSCIETLLSKFNSTYSIPSTSELLSFDTKSQREFISIQQFILTQPNISDNDWIIKTSGRYIFINDSFINTVKNADNNIQGVAKFGCEGKAIYTFCFALRYKWFKMFFLKSSYELSYNCIEKFLVDCFISNNIYDKIIQIENIGILANPDNLGEYNLI